MAKHYIKNTGGGSIPFGTVSLAPNASLFFYDDVAAKTGNLTAIKYSITQMSNGLAMAFRNGTAVYLIDATPNTEEDFYKLLHDLLQSTQPVVQQLLPLVTQQASYGSLNFVVDNGNSLIVPEQVDYVRVPYAGKLLDWSIIADQEGSVVIDVWKSSENTVPVSGNSICNALKPTLVNATTSVMTAIAWTDNTFSQDDVFGFHVVSVSGLKKFRLSIKTIKQ